MYTTTAYYIYVCCTYCGTVRSLISHRKGTQHITTQETALLSVIKVTVRSTLNVIVYAYDKLCTTGGRSSIFLPISTNIT
jgi:hypothetical protein